MTCTNRTLVALLSMGVWAAGCTDRIFFEDGVFEGASTSEGETEAPEDDDEPPAETEGDPPPPDDDDEPPPPVACGDIELTGAVPISIDGEFVQGPSRYEPSCVGAQSAEVTFSFTAPDTQTYFFTTTGSSIDTILYAYGPTCEPPELACNDDSNGTLDASIGISMTAGETVVVVLDGFGQTGTWALQVDLAAACPEQILDPVPELVVQGELVGGEPNSVAPSCGGGGPDVTYSWTPPFSGRFRFATGGSDFDTVLSVHAEDCTTELACNDDVGGNVSSAVELDVVEGVPVVLAVSGFDGDLGTYSLSIFPAG